MTVVPPDAVRRKVAAWLAEQDGADAIALAAAPVWPADPVLVVGDVRLRVVPCPTPLAARAALHDRPDGERLVLLTELADVDLGDGLLAYVSRQTVRPVNPWELVRQMFGGARLDPTLPRTGSWVAAALGDFAPADGWPAPPGSVLTRDHALRCIAAEVLGVRRDQLDSSGLLQWTTDAPALMRFTGVAQTVADGLAAYLAEAAGPAAVPIVAAVRAGHGVDAIPMGLLAGILWPDVGAAGADVAVAVARTRLEPRLGGARLTPPQATAFREAAEAWIDRSLDSGDIGQRHEAMRLLRRAETLASEIDISARLAASSLLPSGFTQRLREFAAQLGAALSKGSPAPGAVARAQRAYESAQDHRAAEPRLLETARMALRLLRWLSLPDTAPPQTLLDALHQHVRQDGWVDRARLDIFAGVIDEPVRDVYRALYRAVDARRAGHDEQFARLLAETTGAEAEAGALLRVEDVLDRVVRPLVDGGRRVLLLVMDGMSVAAATEVGEALTRTGTWLELSPRGGPRTGVLAALPTVTEVSRCSLLSGRIAVGGRDAERAAFARQFPTGRLLHKGDLRAGAGAALDPEIRAALDSADVPVVAAVVNTIDDALDRSEPGTTVWSDDTIPAMRDLLASAPDRVVVLVSDHGHVVDRGPEAVTRPGDTAENRWRAATRPAADGEVTVSGSRVALGGGTVIVPWREELRYGPRKAGYHGGASPAEAVIPLLMLTAVDDDVLPGWAPAPVASPPWWREPVAAAAHADTEPRPAPLSPTPPGRRARPAPSQPDGLFDMPAAAATPSAGDVTATGGRPVGAVPGASITDALLGSERYAQRRGTRAPLPEQRVRALLDALLEHGDRATLETLAAHAGVPMHRINGIVTMLRKLLQVEGYPVLTLDADGQTVVLNRTLLVEQFGLEQP